jgi:2-hydroxychromene-2-carboxylate isomerase
MRIPFYYDYACRWADFVGADFSRGVFGVPTLSVGEEMFWGNDRFELGRSCAVKMSA